MTKELKQKAIEIFEKRAKKNPKIRKGKYHFGYDGIGRRVAAFKDGEFYALFDMEDLGAFDYIDPFFSEP